ncbi:DUF4097 family beta strand repeat-containing protein [Weissella koreensis]|uniref:DUF4097 domain-containing protein n=1 Tax=Weissella koreensis TaxID=165096 RepID=A0A7H1MKY2_9LACO|nr:DUF4097 family beta strand repeat-containing protein [Weissella koreensis]AVH74915.1 hypothetical protein C4597_02300 [Weissella koreensis]QGN20139.1 DUF4097 family beta strand repeat protein [Weissella koreensis]QNT64118.1 DUF4097 domain-containing protein [Weissella koreensis]
MNQELEQKINGIFADYEMILPLQEFKQEVLADANEALRDYRIAHPQIAEDKAIEHVMQDLVDLTPIIEMINGEQNKNLPSVLKTGNEYEEINVNVFAGQVFIVAGQGSTPKVEQVFNHEHPELAVKIDDRLKSYNITTPRLSGWGLFSIFKETTRSRFRNVIKIELPMAYQGDLNLKLNAGEVFITDLALEQHLNLTVSAGVLHVNRVHSQDVRLDLRAGKANLKDVTVNKILQGSVSAGELTLRQVYADFKMNIAAGNVNGVDVSGSGDFDVNAGNLSLEWDQVLNDLDFGTALGNINVRFKPETSYHLNGHTTMGSIRILRDHQVQMGSDNLKAQVGEKPTFNVIAQTSFGNIVIK